jgi:hypothetical protein
MKKRIIALVLLTTTILCGCGASSEANAVDIRDTYNDPYITSNGNRDIPNRFGIIETHEETFETTWYVVYDKKTGVEYMISLHNSQGYSMCPLYNTDGTLMLYDEVL